MKAWMWIIGIVLAAWYILDKYTVPGTTGATGTTPSLLGGFSSVFHFGSAASPVTPPTQNKVVQSGILTVAPTNPYAQQNPISSTGANIGSVPSGGASIPGSPTGSPVIPSNFVLRPPTPATAPRTAQNPADIRASGINQFGSRVAIMGRL